MIALLVEIVVKGVILLFVLITAAAYVTLLERKLIGRIQNRYGPNRAGPFGLLQPAADAIKLLFKEDIIPAGVDRPVFLLAPFVTLLPAILIFAVVPFGDSVTLLGREIPLYLTDLNIAVLYILAITSLGVYGIVLAGWSSNSKYALLGGLRSGSQMISYELSLGLSLVGPLLLAGSFSLVEIVQVQRQMGWFILWQPLAFLIFTVASTAEINRHPFDLPEAEHELTAGYHTEYSGLRFSIFFLAEYAKMVAVGALAATLFLGGPAGPFLPGPIWLLIKVLAFLFLWVWLRGTLPRVRYDRLMALGWKVLLPLALVNIVVTAGGIVLCDSFSCGLLVR